MSKHAEGIYVTRDEAGDLWIERSAHFSVGWNAVTGGTQKEVWIAIIPAHSGCVRPRGEILAGPLDADALCEAVLLGLAHTPREGETCKDCKHLGRREETSRLDRSPYRWCGVREKWEEQNGRACACFSRREKEGGKQ